MTDKRIGKFGSERRRSGWQILGSALAFTGVLAGAGGIASAADLNLSDLNGVNGFVVNGPNTNAFSGREIDFIGDINGDGLDDIIITAPYTNPLGRTRAGEAYVIFGSAVWGSGSSDDPLNGGAEFDISSLSSADGFKLQGANAEDNLGFSAAGIGDINGDGIDDFAVSAPYGELNTIRRNQGEVYVLFGSPFWGTGAPQDPTGGTGALDVGALQVGDGFVVRGEAAYDVLGHDVAGALDVNGDGLSDMVIGSRLGSVAGKPLCGKAYVIFGSTQLAKGGALDPLNGGTVWNNARFNGDFGFIIEGANAGDRAGFSVAGIGDFNGDSRNDLAIGVPLFDAVSDNEGQVKIIFGTNEFGTGSALDPLAGGSTLFLASMPESFGFSINNTASGTQFGTKVAAAGDINADGLADLLVGAPDGGNNTVIGDREGNAFVILGSAVYTTNVPADPVIAGVMNLTSRLGDEVFLFMGGASVDNLGASVAGVGDTTGDGIDDFVIGIPNNDFSAPDAGRVLLIPGSANFGDGSANDPLGGASTINLALFPPGLGMFFNGINGDELLGGDQAGTAVGSGQDFNGDGAPEILISAPQANGGFVRSGQSYIVLGVPAVPDVTGPLLTRTFSNTANAPYGVGSYVDVQLQFDEAVLFDSADGLPTLTLNSGGTANYASGNGTPRLFFSYIVAPGENAADLAISALNLNGASIQDASGNAASLALPVGVNSLNGSSNIEIDTIAPVANRITTTTPSGLYGLTDEILIQLEFSEPMFSATPALVQVGVNSGNFAYFDSGLGTSTIQYSYEVESNESANPLEVISVPVASPNLTDEAGNVWNKVLPTAAGDILSGSALIEVDTKAPEIARITSPTGSGFYKANDLIVIDVELTEGVTVNLNGNTPILTLSNNGIALYNSQPTPSTLRFHYTIGANQNTPDLDVTLFDDDGALIEDQVNLPFTGLVLPTGTDSLAGSGDIVIDSVAPTISEISSTLASGVYKLGTTIPIVLTVSEPVTVTGNPTIALSNSRTAQFTTQTSQTELLFEFTVNAGSDTPLLNSTQVLNAAGIIDAAGNSLTTAITPGAALASNRMLALDATQPTITLLPVDPALGSLNNFATYSFEYSIVEANTPLIGLDFSDPASLVLSNATFDFVDTINRIISVSPSADGPVSVQFAEGRFTDAAGNGNTASNTLTYTSDRTPPTIALATTEITDGGVTNNVSGFEFTATVNGTSSASIFDPLNPAQITLVNATATTATVLNDVYTFNVIPEGDGVVSITIPAGAVFDDASNINTATAPFNYTVSTERPTALVGGFTVAQGGYYTGTNFPFIVNFNGGITPYSAFNPLVTSGVAATNATISKEAGDTTYGFTVTPQSEGLVTVQIPEAAISDVATNTSTASNLFSFTIDRTAPVLSLSSADVANGGLITTAPPYTFTVTLTESSPVADFNPQNPAHLQLTNATASAANKVGSTYTFTLTQGVDGVVTAQIPAGAITDPAGNSNAASPLYSFTASTTVPTAALNTSSVTAGAFSASPSFAFEAVFTQGLPPYSGFNPLLTSDVVATNAAVTVEAGDGAFGFTITPTADGPVSVQIPAGAISDSVLAGNTASSVFNFTSDQTAPVASLSSSAVNSGDAISTLDPIEFTVQFTDTTNLSTFDPQNTSQFTVTNAVVSSATRVGDEYTFMLTPVGDGLITAWVRANAVSDQAGNTNVASNMFTLVVSTGVPAAFLSSTMINSGDATNLSTLDFATTFTSGLAPYSGFVATDVNDVLTTNALLTKLPASDEFEFQIQPIMDGVVSVQVQPGAITDSALVPNTASQVFSFVYDTIRPEVLISSSQVTLNELTNISTPIVFTVEVVDATNTSLFNPQAAGVLLLENATVSTATRIGNLYTFNLTPVADGLVSIEVLPNVLSDAAGNLNTGSAPFLFQVDTIAPVLTQTLTYAGANPTSVSPLSFTFEADEELASFTASDVSLSAPLGVGPLSVVNINATGTEPYVYTFQVSGMLDSGTVSVTLLTNQLGDAAGNMIVGTPPSINVDWIDRSAAEDWMILND